MMAGADTSLGARIALWGGREIVGAHPGLAGRRPRDHALRGLSLPSARALRRARQPAGHAGRVGLGDAGRHPRPAGACRSASTGRCWQLMGDGIDWMIAVALWVASLPGAVGRMAAFGTGPLLLGTAGLIVLCLLRTPLRWSARALVVVAMRAGAAHAAAGRAGRGERRQLRGARAGRPAAGAQARQRRVRDPRMARRRRRCARRSARGRGADKAREGIRLRRRRLHRPGSPTARSSRSRTSPAALRRGLRARRAGGHARARAPPACAATVIDRTRVAPGRGAGAAAGGRTAGR